MTGDLFTDPCVAVALENAEQFTDGFLAYLPENLHVYRAFKAETVKVARKGFKHYSARTIIEVLRHNSALAETGGPWKLNDHNTPYLARLLVLECPELDGMFEFREAKAANAQAIWRKGGPHG